MPSSVVNNAGICMEAGNPLPIDQVDEDMFDAHMRINTRGVFLGCKYAVRQFKAQVPHPNGMRGWIVNLASMVSNIGMQGLSELFHAFENFALYVGLTCPSWVYGVQRCCCSYDPNHCAGCCKRRHRRQLYRSWM
jgi:NAD(P)-dependent dehydrogenase (short-subunit alcohol dehydrogenase family)